MSLLRLGSDLRPGYALAEIAFAIIMIGTKRFSKRCNMRAAVFQPGEVQEWPRKYPNEPIRRKKSGAAAARSAALALRGRLDSPQVQDPRLEGDADGDQHRRPSRRGGWHHPDITASYAWVEVRLQNHAAKGITDKDFELAKKIEEVVQWQPGKAGGALEGTPEKDQRFAYIKYD